MSDALLTDGEAARLLRMSVRRLLRLVRQRAVPHVQLPDVELRFDAADLRDWIAEHKHGSQSEGASK